jgi:hypothetical protein
MAIGKVNAYATVEGPKVDFGDIALNAQKIQQADLDRMKSMIPEEKKSDFKIKDLDTGIKKTGNGGYDQTLTSYLDEKLLQNLEIDKEAERMGRYTPELIAKKQKLQNEVTGLKGLAEKFTTDTIEFSKKLEEGKLSSVDESRFNIIEDIAAKRNLEILTDDSGNTVFKVRMVGDDGSFLSDSDGKPLYKTFNDRGVARDSITKYELENGALFGNSIKELDREKTIGAIQNNLKLRTEEKDPNGTVSRIRTYLNDDDYDVVNDKVNGVLNNYDNLASYLYSLDREKYATPKTMEQYKKDGDFELASNAMRKSVLAGLGFQDKEQRVKPNVTNVNLGKEDKTNYVSPIASEKIVTYRKDGKVKGRRAKGYMLSVNQNDDNIFVGSQKAQLEGVGYDNDSKRFYISYFAKVGENKKVDGGSESTSVSETRYLPLNGKAAKVSVANTIIPKLSFQDENGNIRKYKDVGELIEAIKRADPNGKYFGSGEAKKTTTNKKAATGGKVR